MTAATTNLFVYGTLMPGFCRFPLIQRYVHSVRSGTIQGILINLGAFPAFVPGDGIVKGIVLEVDNDAINVTDRIEGYEPDRETSLYLRKSVAVTLEDGEEVTAWTYEFANPDGISDRPRLVVGDDNGVPIHAWNSCTDLRDDNPN